MSDETALTPAQERMLEAYLHHTGSEFVTQSPDEALTTMGERPNVILLPSMTGGLGRDEVHGFYADHFIFGMPDDVEFVPVSQTVGSDTIVEESVLRFTHTAEISWMLPGLAPTGRRVEVGVCTVVRMKDDKVVHEHVYWDQASVLNQLGLLDAEQLPVVGAEAAQQLLEPKGPLNQLIERARKRAAESERT